MRFYVLAISSLLWIVTVQATPTGNHTCTGVVKHSVTVRVNVTEPVTYRTYTWCLKVPPRCSKYTVQLKDRVKIHTEMHNRTITVCCKGYVEMDYKCVPACPPQTECPNMHCNRTNHCYCTPGYQGLYCNYPCDRGFWGTDCKKTCDCPVGFTCHHLTGDCMIDDRPASKSRRTTTTTAATFSPETTNTEDTRTTASPHILTKSTAPPTLRTTLTSTSTTSMPTTITTTTTTTIPTTQSTIPRTTQEATTSSTVSLIPTTPRLSVKIHIEEHNPQHRENNIPTTITPTLEPDSSTSSTTEIKYDVIKKVVFPEISSTTTLAAAKIDEETFSNTELSGKHPNISEATLEATTTLAAATESSVIPSIINSTTRKEETIPELTTTSPSPSTTVGSPSGKVTTFVPSVDVLPEVLTSSAVFTTSTASADVLPEVSTSSAVLTTSSSAGDLKEIFSATTTTVTPELEATSSRGSITNIFEELTSTTTINPTTLSTTIVDQDEQASTLSTLQRTTPKDLYEVSTTLSTITTTSRTLDELTSTSSALPTTHRTLDELTSASTTLPSTFRTLEKLNYTTEPRILDELTSTSSTLPTTLRTLDELTSSSGTPSSIKSTAEELINLSSTSPTTLTTVNELTSSTSVEPKVQITLEEMTSIPVPKTTVESLTTTSTISSTTPSTMPEPTSTPEYTVSSSVLSTPKPLSSTTSFSSINYFTLPSNEKTHETNPPSTASTLSDKDKSTMSFNELNKTVDQYISLTTTTLQTVQPVVQINVGNDRLPESELSSEEPRKKDNTTPNPYLSRKITEGKIFDFPITTSPDILPNLENNEMTTIKITTIHPFEDATIRKESDGINVNLEGELMKTVETDRRSGVERNEDLNRHEQITKIVPDPKVTLATLTEPEIFTTTESIRVTKETFDIDLDKLLAKTEIKNIPSSTMVTNSFHGTIYSDNDSVTETTTYQARDEETGKVSNIKKILLNDTNLISGINEVSTIFDREKLSDNEKLKQKPETVTTMANKEETSSNLQQWITTNSRPAHTWYSHSKENQRKMKIKDDLKATSHLDTQVNTERYDMSEESNVIDSMLTTFAEKGSRSNSAAPVFVNEETNIPSSYLNHGQMKYNLSSALAEEVQAGRNENSLFTLYSASTLISCIALILLVAASTAVWFCLRRRKEPTTLRRPCIMAYETPNELSLNPLMYETVYPLESIEGEQFVDPDIFFCPTFTNNYAEKINRELSELNYDHPRSSVCEPLYAEIRY